MKFLYLFGILFSGIIMASAKVLTQQFGNQAMFILGKVIAPIALVVCCVLYLATLMAEQKHGKDDK